MLEIYSKQIMRGLQVPDDLRSEELHEALDILLPEHWRVVEPPAIKMTINEREPVLQIEAPWGWIPALPGDFVLLDEKGVVSVMPRFHFKNLRLQRVKVADLTIKETS